MAPEPDRRLLVLPVFSRAFLVLPYCVPEFRGELQRLLQWRQTQARIRQTTEQIRAPRRRIPVGKFDDRRRVVHIFVFWSQRGEGNHRKQFAELLGHIDGTGVDEFPEPNRLARRFQAASYGSGNRQSPEVQLACEGVLFGPGATRLMLLNHTVHCVLVRLWKAQGVCP